MEPREEKKAKYFTPRSFCSASCISLKFSLSSLVCLLRNLSSVTPFNSSSSAFDDPEVEAVSKKSIP